MDAGLSDSEHSTDDACIQVNKDGSIKMANNKILVGNFKMQAIVKYMQMVEAWEEWMEKHADFAVEIGLAWWEKLKLWDAEALKNANKRVNTAPSSAPKRKFEEDVKQQVAMFNVAKFLGKRRAKHIKTTVLEGNGAFDVSSINHVPV